MAHGFLFRHKIINQHTDICLRTVEHQRLSPKDLHRRIDSRDKPLARRLLISTAAIKLSAGKKPLDIFKFQRSIKLICIDTIILDRISITDNFYILQSRKRAVI